MRFLLIAFFASVAVSASALEPLRLSGTFASSDSAFELVDFDVPEGVVEIEVRHTDNSARNVIDFGLRGPNGFRGWGGGNSEPAIVGVQSASRSYLPGPMVGRWQAVLGKALIVESPASWSLEIVFRDAASLEIDPERQAFSGDAVLSEEQRWYAGDFHVHSYESGDARPKLDEIAEYARSRGLDFVALSDHNTVSQLDFLDAAQARHPDLLFVPSVEFTTYSGHANGLGATRPVSHLMGVDTDITQAAEAFAEQNAVFGINHPVLNLGDLCLGCAWKHELNPALIGSVEIGTGGWDTTGLAFGEAAIAFWDEMLDEESRAAAVGGSDDHQAGQDTGMVASPIGNPTTMVFARNQSWKAIVDAVREGRTVVKLQGPDDPMVELSLGAALIGDEVRWAPGESGTLQATVTGGVGHELRFVVDGVPEDAVSIDADPFVFEKQVERPDALQRWRAEVVVKGYPRTVTSHIWVKPGPVEGCGCDSQQAAGALAGLMLLVVGFKKRRRRLVEPV